MAVRLTSEHKHAAGVQGDIDWLKGMLTSLGLRSFHGKIVINYEKGRIRNVVEERSHKPPN